MHIVLAALGAIVTILVLLHRLADIGIDFGGLNPFAWKRRRAWRQKFDANPVFSLDDSRAIAAVLLVGVAKIDGDLTAGEKQGLLAEFESVLSLEQKAATDLLSSTVFLLGDLHVFKEQLHDLVRHYRERLTADQIESLFGMIDRIAALDGGPTAQQRELMSALRAAFAAGSEPQGTWG